MELVAVDVRALELLGEAVTDDVRLAVSELDGDGVPDVPIVADALLVCDDVHDDEAVPVADGTAVRVGVAVGVGVLELVVVGVGVFEGVAVGVAVRVVVDAAVPVIVSDGEGEAVVDGDGVIVDVPDGVPPALSDADDDAVTDAVLDAEAVIVGETLAVRDALAVGDKVCVADGDGSAAGASARLRNSVKPHERATPQKPVEPLALPVPYATMKLPAAALDVAGAVVNSSTRSPVVVFVYAVSPATRPAA